MTLRRQPSTTSWRSGPLRALAVAACWSALAACAQQGSADAGVPPDGGADASADGAPNTATDTATDTAPDTATDTAPEAEVGGGGDATAPRLGPYDCLVAPHCGRILVAAHRGYHHDVPENSLAALRASAAVGADFMECDVRHTADGVLVLMHDAEVDRTTDGTGKVDALTWAQVQALNLKGGDPSDPETLHPPRFDDVLALARELGIMLYVDQKTGHTDDVLALIAGGDYYDVALVRDGWQTVAAQKAQDPKLEVLAAVGSWEDFQAAQAAIPGLRIVELTQPLPDADFNAQVHAAGVKVQQDVIAGGDLLATQGDYSGWGGFVDAGVDLMQTEFPQLLLPALASYEETGAFPATGPSPDAAP